MNVPGKVPSQRPVLQRILIRSWEHRHLRFLAGFRIVAGIMLAFCGVATLSVNAYGWAALFLVPAPPRPSPGKMLYEADRSRR